MNVHRILVKDAATAVGAQALIEHRLGVETWVRNEREWGWSIDFAAPADVDLSFLRPHILPPR